MNKLREYAVRFNGWLTNHWRLVMWCMLMVMMMQQCTISRLRWEVTQITQGHPYPPMPPAMPATDSTFALPTTPPDTSALAFPGADTLAEEESSAGSIWIVGLIVVILAGAALAVFYMRRNGIYPIGISLRGKLNSNMTYHIKVSNHSRKTVEVSEPLVVFIMGGAVRKFRANIPQLPMTLDRGTSFEATIDLSGLVRANIDLTAAKAINMSVATNGKRHSTLPTPVKIKTM